MNILTIERIVEQLSLITSSFPLKNGGTFNITAATMRALFFNFNAHRTVVSLTLLVDNMYFRSGKVQYDIYGYVEIY